MQLHSRLSEVRKERGLSLKDVADRTDISLRYLSGLERGRQAITA